MMFIYPVFDIQGFKIGSLELNSNVIPEAIMNGISIRLDGSYLSFEKKFLNFIIVPIGILPLGDNNG